MLNTIVFTAFTILTAAYVEPCPQVLKSATWEHAKNSRSIVTMNKIKGRALLVTFSSYYSGQPSKSMLFMLDPDTQPMSRDWILFGQCKNAYGESLRYYTK